MYEAFTVQGESEDQTAGNAAEVVPPGVPIQLTPPAASAASVSDRRATHPDSTPLLAHLQTDPDSELDTKADTVFFLLEGGRVKCIFQCTIG